jgi:hypothetical protein
MKLDNNRRNFRVSIGHLGLIEYEVHAKVSKNQHETVNSKKPTIIKKIII